MKYLLPFIISCFIITFSVQARDNLKFRAEKSAALDDPTKTVLYLPLDTISITYVNNTRARPTIEFSDSFYLSAANDLLLFELSKYFAPGKSAADSAITHQFTKSGQRWSSFDKNKGSFDSVSAFVKIIAAQSNADLIAIPYSCSLKNSAIMEQGWRNGRSGPSYDRPVKYSSTTTFYLQIWDNQGTLLYEKAGYGRTGQSVLYPVLTKKKKSIDDIVVYSKKLLAAPLVKALAESARDAVSFY